MTACELANGVVPFADIPTTLMLTEKVRGSAPQLLDHSTIAPLYEEEGGQQSALHGTLAKAFCSVCTNIDTVAKLITENNQFIVIGLRPGCIKAD